MHGLARALLRKFRKMRFPYEPLIEVRISREALLQNLETFQNLNKSVAAAPVLKSNAYGHGLVEVAGILDRENLPFLCVDSYFEALILRNEGIRSPILILGYTPIENMLGSRLKDVAFGIISTESLRQLYKNSTARVAIHLKIDTGMHRHGIMPEELPEAIRLIRANKSIVLEGVYSHFADADTSDSPHARAQSKEWNMLVEKIKKEFPNVKYFHCANSAGAAYHEKIQANAMRLGIGLYGFDVTNMSLPLRPALEMVTRVTSMRTLQKGESVGYNATFTAQKDIRIATIPAGYYEGIDRRLSSKGAVTIRGTVCPIVGRVSMNITSVDVTNLPDVKIDEPVVAISSNPSDQNSVETIARVCSTIPYEILVHIPAHLRRVVV